MEAPHTPTPESVPLFVTLGGLQVCSYSGAQNRLVSSAELSGGKRRPEWEGAANPPSLWLWRQRKGPPAKERSGLRKLETSRRFPPWRLSRTPSGLSNRSSRSFIPSGRVKHLQEDRLQQRETSRGSRPSKGPKGLPKTPHCLPGQAGHAALALTLAVTAYPQGLRRPDAHLHRLLGMAEISTSPPQTRA